MGGAIVAAVVGGLVVALLGNLMLDLLRGTPQRIEGRLERLLRGIAEEEDRERWREELQGVLLEFGGRPLKQFREGSEVIKAAEALIEVYRPQEERRVSPTAAVVPEEVDRELPVTPERMLDLRRVALRLALDFLSYRELRVLELRHGLGGEPPQSAEAVGRKFNVVPSVIDRIERQAIMKVESFAEAQKLREALGPGVDASP